MFDFFSLATESHEEPQTPVASNHMILNEKKSMIVKNE